MDENVKTCDTVQSITPIYQKVKENGFTSLTETERLEFKQEILSSEFEDSVDMYLTILDNEYNYNNPNELVKNFLCDSNFVEIRTYLLGFLKEK